jgi:hypothetical protein
VKTTVEKISPLIILDDKKIITKNGYAIIDEYGCCIIIVYDENKMKIVLEYLTNNK